jgi:hypothetical protein
MHELDLRIRNHVYGSFVQSAQAPTPTEVAAALELDVPTVEESYRRLHEAHALVLESGETRIRMLNPFSAVETRHRVFAAGREWFANCAWDALGIPGALHTDGRVESACPDCGERLELEIADGELARGNDLIVHFVVPARRWWDDIVFT